VRLVRIPGGLILAVGVVLAAGLSGLASPQPQLVRLAAGSPQNEFTFTPREVVASVGLPVTVTVANGGRVDHDFRIEAIDVKIPPVAPGKSASTTFTPARKGPLEFFCTVPGHKEVGMKGILLVK
jgi:uncharacterized cupredoxin-like copper-binding protein